MKTILLTCSMFIWSLACPDYWNSINTDPVVAIENNKVDSNPSDDEGTYLLNKETAKGISGTWEKTFINLDLQTINKTLSHGRFQLQFMDSGRFQASILNKKDKVYYTCSGFWKVTGGGKTLEVQYRLPNGELQTDALPLEYVQEEELIVKKPENWLQIHDGRADLFLNKV